MTEQQKQLVKDLDRALTEPRHSLSPAYEFLRDLLRDRDLGKVYFNRRVHFGFQVLHRPQSETGQPARMELRGSTDGVFLKLWIRTKGDAWDKEQRFCSLTDAVAEFDRLFSKFVLAAPPQSGGEG